MILKNNILIMNTIDQIDSNINIVYLYAWNSNIDKIIQHLPISVNTICFFGGSILDKMCSFSIGIKNIITNRIFKKNIEKMKIPWGCKIFYIN
jgi:hypothetical protein